MDVAASIKGALPKIFIGFHAACYPQRRKMIDDVLLSDEKELEQWWNHRV